MRRLVCLRVLALPAIAAAAPVTAIRLSRRRADPGRACPPAWLAVAAPAELAAGTGTGGTGVNAVISVSLRWGLDPVFGDGVARPSLVLRFAVVDLALQPDGRIVVISGPSASVAQAPTSGFAAARRRYPSFGGGDRLAPSVDDGFDSAGALAVHPTAESWCRHWRQAVRWPRGGGRPSPQTQRPAGPLVLRREASPWSTLVLPLPPTPWRSPDGSIEVAGG
jgi:hypothetical protein